jgi:hypothetical protein
MSECYVLNSARIDAHGNRITFAYDNLNRNTRISNELDYRTTYSLYGLRRPLVKQGWRRVEETVTGSTRFISEIAGRRVSPPVRA